MAQILVEGGRPDRNLARAVDAITAAGETGCDFVVLPECLDVGWTDPSAATLAEKIPGHRSDVLCRAAAESGIYVVAGLVERSDSKLFNAAVLVSADGGILLKHRKINELDFARSLYATGKSLEVADTRFGSVGVNICADNFPDSLDIARALGWMGARIILSPCAWAVAADHDNEREPYGGLWKQSYTALAASHRIPVVGVSNVGWITGGPWEGRKCIGCSLAVSADGCVAAEGPYGEDAEALVRVEIEVSK